MSKRRKWLVVLGVLAGVACASLLAIFLPGQASPTAEPPTTLQSLIDDGTLVDTPPEEIWKEDPGAGKHSFTPRAVLGDDMDSIGVLTIEKIGVSIQVYDSENTMEDMKKGASHYRASSYWDGNVAVAAHIGNASYSYFERLRELKPGDIVEYETTLGMRRYKVAEIRTIADDDWSVIDRTEQNCLTMTTCVAGNESQRLCVRAVEVPPA